MTVDRNHEDWTRIVEVMEKPLRKVPTPPKEWIERINHPLTLNGPDSYYKIELYLLDNS